MNHYHPPTEVGDPDLIEAANRSFDAHTGFSLKSKELGFNRLRYPPYIPVPPNYVTGMTTDEELHDWHHHWFNSHFHPK